MSIKISEFRLEKIAILRWIGLFAQMRSMQPIIYTKVVKLHFSFLTV